jgi:16S rRNA processing protein RimM
MSGRRSAVPSHHFCPDDVRLGHFVGVFGLRGELRVYLHNPLTELFEHPREVVLVSPDGSRREVRLGLRPGAGRRILGRVEGVGSIEDAERLVGSELVVGREVLPPLPEGEWYHHELIGCVVSTGAGRELGTLVAIQDAGTIDTWEVVGSEGRFWIHAVLEDIIEVVPGQKVVVEDHAPMKL